jgi:hypothetical protein
MFDMTELPEGRPSHLQRPVRLRDGNAASFYLDDVVGS